MGEFEAKLTVYIMKAERSIGREMTKEALDGLQWTRVKIFNTRIPKLQGLMLWCGASTFSPILAWGLRLLRHRLHTSRLINESRSNRTAHRHVAQHDEGIVESTASMI